MRDPQHDLESWEKEETLVLSGGFRTEIGLLTTPTRTRCTICEQKIAADTATGIVPDHPIVSTAHDRPTAMLSMSFYLCIPCPSSRHICVIQSISNNVPRRIFPRSYYSEYESIIGRFCRPRMFLGRLTYMPGSCWHPAMHERC
jgi:hypothetical protein